MKFFTIVLALGLQTLLQAQQVCAYWPLDKSFGAYEGKSMDSGNVEIGTLGGQRCALFKRPVDGVDHGLETRLSEKQSKTFSDASNVWVIFDFFAGEQFTNYAERIVQMGGDDDFMIRTNNNTVDNGLLELDFCFGANYDRVDVKANTWTRCVFRYSKPGTVYLDFYSLNENGTSNLEASKQLSLFQDIQFNSPFCFANKNTRSPDKFAGGIKNIIFGVGSLAIPQDISRFTNLSSLPRAVVDENGNLVISKINPEPYKVGGQLQYPDYSTEFSPAICPLRNVEWIVQGNSAINDDYTFISKKSDTLIYDAWIDRGDWVTLQVRGELGFTGEVVKSNIIRHYVEENASRSDEIAMEHVAVIQENETLRFRHQSVAATQCYVYNMTGQKQLNWDGEGVLDISNLHDGAYVLRVIDKEGHHFSHKFIK